MVRGTSFVYSETKAHLVHHMQPGGLKHGHCIMSRARTLAQLAGNHVLEHPSRAPERFRYVNHLDLLMRLVILSRSVVL